MAVQVVGGSLMTSDHTGHQARSVGAGGWVVSFMPGRTLTIEQATAAMQAAEVVAAFARQLADELTAIRAYAVPLGLTALELVGMAAGTCARDEIVDIRECAGRLGLAALELTGMTASPYPSPPPERARRVLPRVWLMSRGETR